MAFPLYVIQTQKQRSSYCLSVQIGVTITKKQSTLLTGRSRKMRKNYTQPTETNWNHSNKCTRHDEDTLHTANKTKNCKDPKDKEMQMLQTVINHGFYLKTKEHYQNHHDISGKSSQTQPAQCPHTRRENKEVTKIKEHLKYNWHHQSIAWKKLHQHSTYKWCRLENLTAPQSTC